MTDAPTVPSKVLPVPSPPSPRLQSLLLCIESSLSNKQPLSASPRSHLESSPNTVTDCSNGKHARMIDNKVGRNWPAGFDQFPQPDRRCSKLGPTADSTQPVLEILQPGNEDYSLPARDLKIVSTDETDGTQLIVIDDAPAHSEEPACSTTRPNIRSVDDSSRYMGGDGK